jgi:FkbM family methyltransferase
MKEGWYEFALRTGFLLNSLNFDFTVLTGRLEQAERFEPYSTVFRILNFLKRHKGEVSYAEKGKFKLRELDENFVFGYKDIDILNSYFGAKKEGKIRFFTSNGNFFAKVQNLVFLIPFPHGVWELTETFLKEDYGDFSVKNGTVIDVGAFIGDTAIYFATKGAKRVLAFEPAPPTFHIAQENIKMNKLQNAIEIRNKAVGRREGEEKFRFTSSRPGGSSMVFPDTRPSRYYQVKTTTLNQVMSEVGYVDLLKMDCEGAEYQILPLALKDGNLKNISNIILEVHGPPQEILNTLRAGHFKIVKHQAHHDGAHLISASKNNA